MLCANNAVNAYYSDRKGEESTSGMTTQPGGSSLLLYWFRLLVHRVGSKRDSLLASFVQLPGLFGIGVDFFLLLSQYIVSFIFLLYPSEISFIGVICWVDMFLKYDVDTVTCEKKNGVIVTMLVLVCRVVYFGR